MLIAQLKKKAIWKLILLFFLVFLSMVSKSNGAIELTQTDGVLYGSIIIPDNKSDALITKNRTKIFAIKVAPDKDATLKIDKIGLANHSSLNIESTEEKRVSLYYGGGLIKTNLQLMKATYEYYDIISAIVLGICFGIALKLENVKLILRRPIGLCIAMFCKFVFSPLVSDILME